MENCLVPYGVQPAINIHWDMENCPVPHGVDPENIAGNVRVALREHLGINIVVNTFSAYGDFNKFSDKVRHGCHHTGIRLRDVPSGRKNSTDIAMITDMMNVSSNNPTPNYVMLISGDADFAMPLHRLNDYGYTIFLAIPAKVNISSALYKAAKSVCYWPSLASGEGWVPCTSHCPDIRDFEHPREPVNMQYDEISMQPSDIQHLKVQLVKLIESSGGRLAIGRVLSKYQKKFKVELRVTNYGKHKLADLIELMSDVMTVEGNGREKCVCLHNGQGPTVLRNDKKVKLSDNNISKCGDAACSSDDLLVGKRRERSICLHNKQEPRFFRNDKNGKILEDHIAECGDATCFSGDFLNKQGSYGRLESSRSYEKGESSNSS